MLVIVSVTSLRMYKGYCPSVTTITAGQFQRFRRTVSAHVRVAICRRAPLVALLPSKERARHL